MATIDLPHGTLHYRVTGPADPEAPPVVFVHGFLVDSHLWDPVAERLADQGITSYLPDLPLGSHPIALADDADQSPRGVARRVVDFLEALDLDDVTLVGNDTGGAICQFVLDTDPRRIGRLVLTNCDAFDQFPPAPFNIMFRFLAGRARYFASVQPLRSRRLRHSPLGLAPLAHHLDPVVTRAWAEPSLTDAGVRRDAVRFLRAVKPADLADVATRLPTFEGPVSLIWGADDTAFTPELGRRLQGAFADARFVEVPNSRTFVSLDAPDVLADEIAGTRRGDPSTTQAAGETRA